MIDKNNNHSPEWSFTILVVPYIHGYDIYCLAEHSATVVANVDSIVWCDISLAKEVRHMLTLDLARWHDSTLKPVERGWSSSLHRVLLLEASLMHQRASLCWRGAVVIC